MPEDWRHPDYAFCTWGNNYPRRLLWQPAVVLNGDTGESLPWPGEFESTGSALGHVVRGLKTCLVD